MKEISVELVDALNLRLEWLDILKSGSEYYFEKKDFSEENPSNKKFFYICDALLIELNKYNDAVKYSSKIESVDQIFSNLNSIAPYFTQTCIGMRYKMLTFLCSLLQAELLSYKSKQMEVSDDIAPAFATEDVVKTNQQIRGKLAFQLDKISKALHVKADSACNEEDVLDLIMDVLNKTLAAHPDLPSRSIDIILKDVGEVNSQQRNILEQIENSFFEDFQLRRRMLMKRLEVTIQSFLWSEKASCKEDEIQSAVKAQQIHLTESPKYYKVEDALLAPVALLYEQSKKVTGDTQEAGSSKSIVKRILVGTVPDRGGRANEIRPKQWKEASGGGWNKGGGKGGGGRAGNSKDNNNDGNKSNGQHPSAKQQKQQQSTKQQQQPPVDSQPPHKQHQQQVKQPQPGKPQQQQAKQQHRPSK